MPPNPRNVQFPNVFYVILLITSTLFVMTSLAWLVSPTLRQISEEDKAAGAAVRVDDRSLTLGDWIDRNAVQILTVEFGVMLVAGVLAMGADSLWEKRRNAS
jgi:hypothetical protein